MNWIGNGMLTNGPVKRSIPGKHIDIRILRNLCLLTIVFLLSYIVEKYGINVILNRVCIFRLDTVLKLF